MNHWPYLPFLVAWALPVVAVQWLLGGRYLWRERRIWPLIVLAFAVYFTIADAVAIQAHIWRFDNAALIGVAIGPVPIEEVLFYLLTAAMVVQGFVTLIGAWGDRCSLAHAWQTRMRQLPRLRLRRSEHAATGPATPGASTAAPTATRLHADAP